MARNTFDTSIEGIKSIWGPLSTAEVVAGYRRNLEALLEAPATEDWLASLRKEGPASKELYRDSKDGFLLLAHTEYAGLYRLPNDYGRGWVIYAIQQGEIEMRSYGPVEDDDGRIHLVRRNSTLVRPGHVHGYLPGDIHDTRCISGPVFGRRQHVSAHQVFPAPSSRPSDTSAKSTHEDPRPPTQHQRQECPCGRTMSQKSEQDIVAESLHAIQAIYFAWQLEQMRAFQVVERLSELFAQGLLPIGPGPTGRLLSTYFFSKDRLSLNGTYFVRAA